MKSHTLFTALSLGPLLAWASPQFRPSHKQADCEVGQTVDTSSGPVAGHAAEKYSEVSEYLGIPYAQAPVGELRFAAPEKYVGSEILNGSSYGFSCPLLPSPETPPPTPEIIEFSNITKVGLELLELIGSPPGVEYSEDCLSLNVWSKPQSGESRKAVLVFIHGGAFSGGTSHTPTFNGATLAEKEDVVIVTLNYRLSVLGFPGNPNSQNNLAFLDQRLAMEWVRDNIANFGGDPDRITLFGQSAGAASADYYGYAYASDPIAAGLISQSGTTFSFGLPYTEPVSAANWYTVTQGVGCGNASTDPTEQLSCMRNADYNAILSAVPTDGIGAILSAFGPTADNVTVFADYTTQPPPAIPILVGSNDYEAGQFRTQLALANTTFPDADWEEMNLAVYTCTAGLRANASVAANSAPVWRYRYHGVFPNTNISSEGGAYHGAELPLIFGTNIPNPPDTPEEIAIEKYLQGAWTTFAKDPVAGLSSYEDGWPLYDPSEETLVRLAYESEVGTNLAKPEVYDGGCAGASLADLLCRTFGVCEGV